MGEKGPSMLEELREHKEATIVYFDPITGKTKSKTGTGNEIADFYQKNPGLLWESITTPRKKAAPQ